MSLSYFRVKISCVVVIVLLAYSGCKPTVKTDAVGLKDITICQYGDLLIYLPLYIAADQGFFEKEGLRVKFINGGGDDKTFAAVASNAAQFGVSDPTFTAIAREKGQPAVVVGTVVAGATYWGVTWKENIKPTRSAEGLKDLRIATYESPSTNYSLMAKTLKENAAAVGNAKIVQGAYGSLLAMLKADKADIAMELEPVASTAVKQGARIVFSYPEMYGPFLLTGIYSLESYRDANPEIVQGVVNALERAMQFAHSNVEGAIQVARHKFPEVDPDVIRNAVERMIKEATLPKHVTMDPEGWRNTTRVRIELGDLKDPESANNTLDPMFAMKAMEQIKQVSGSE
jgi:NitT/TauT family transport system substrate-binding protein